MILVVICHLTSMVHLIPSKQTYGAKDIAELMFNQICKHHRMPSHMVSYWDTLFMSIFWKIHPQSDGATERANHTMTQMLPQCVARDQRNWVKKLPLIEFAMNSASSATTSNVGDH